jgi:transcriptional regulator with XRE-family HTH domain
MMTNQALGELIGVDHSMASRLRSGERLPSPDTMRRIADAFGVDGGVLLREHGKGRASFGLYFSQLIREYMVRVSARAAVDGTVEVDPSLESEPPVEVPTGA